MGSESEDDVEKNTQTKVQIEEKVQQSTKDAKPAIAGLPMDDASEAWMNDDVGTIDSESEDEVEKFNETTVDKEEKTKEKTKQAIIFEDKDKDKQTPKDAKPAIAGLPMDDASDAWMNDDVGTIDSESEDDVEKVEETTVQIKEEVKQSSEDTKPAIAGLPMDDASDAWM